MKLYRLSSEEIDNISTKEQLYVKPDKPMPYKFYTELYLAISSAKEMVSLLVDEDLLKINTNTVNNTDTNDCQRHLGAWLTKENIATAKANNYHIVRESRGFKDTYFLPPYGIQFRVSDAALRENNVDQLHKKVIARVQHQERYVIYRWQTRETVVSGITYKAPDEKVIIFESEWQKIKYGNPEITYFNEDRFVLIIECDVEIEGIREIPVD